MSESPKRKKLDLKAKQELEAKFQMLADLERKHKELKQKDVELTKTMRPSKKLMATELPTRKAEMPIPEADQSNNKSKEVRIKRIPKSKQRLPSMKMVYDIIGEVLGEEAKNKVKEKVKDNRKGPNVEVVCTLKRITFDNSEKSKTETKSKTMKPPKQNLNESVSRYSKRVRKTE